VTLERNPRSWDRAAAGVARVLVRLRVAPETGLLAFLRGELDLLTDVSAADLLRFERQPGWRGRIIRGASLSNLNLLCDVGRPPCNDRRVRRALNLAVRRGDLERFSRGLLVPARGVIPPGLDGYDAGASAIEHDPAQARVLLAAAGYPNGFELAYVTPNDEAYLKLAQSLAADLEEIGVHLRIQPVSALAHVTMLVRGELGFGLAPWTADYPDAASFFEPLDGTHPESNYSHYQNAELDQLLAQARETAAPAARAALFRRADALVRADAAYIWLGHPVQVEIAQPWLAGYAWSPLWTNLRRVRFEP
jgi:ABC-type transport system substrate-binding protein